MAIIHQSNDLTFVNYNHTTFDFHHFELAPNGEETQPSSSPLQSQYITSDVMIDSFSAGHFNRMSKHKTESHELCVWACQEELGQCVYMSFPCPSNSTPIGIRDWASNVITTLLSTFRRWESYCLLVERHGFVTSIFRLCASMRVTQVWFIYSV